MTKYVVAVSGGVDSVTLLDMMSHVPGHDIVVAHFDHGIRVDSADDAIFVANLAAKYGFTFETKREELGAHASEDVARQRRYDFLRSVAAKHNGKIVTAHHADDAVETIAINLHRGTGWRGLAVLNSTIVRPLVAKKKSDLLHYAKVNNLQWREDSTNSSDAYLRNRLRHRINELDAGSKQELLQRRQKQIDHKIEIDTEVRQLIGTGPHYSRYFFTHIPTVVAVECLRAVTGAKLTRPQLERALLAIKTAAPKSTYHAGGRVNFDFTTRNFSLSLLK
jgi:tRNA(Ile)-lysidine synthase